MQLDYLHKNPTDLISKGTNKLDLVKENILWLIVLIYKSQLYTHVHLSHFFQQVSGFSCKINWSRRSDCYPLPLFVIVLLGCNADPEKIRNPCCFLQFHLVSTTISILAKKWQCYNAEYTSLRVFWSRIHFVYLRFQPVKLICRAPNYFFCLFIEDREPSLTTCIRNPHGNYISGVWNTEGKLRVWKHVLQEIGLINLEVKTSSYNLCRSSGNLHTSTQIQWPQ